VIDWSGQSGIICNYNHKYIDTMERFDEGTVDRRKSIMHPDEIRGNIDKMYEDWSDGTNPQSRGPWRAVLDESKRDFRYLGELCEYIEQERIQATYLGSFTHIAESDRTSAMDQYDKLHEKLVVTLQEFLDYAGEHADQQITGETREGVVEYERRVGETITAILKLLEQTAAADLTWRR
jgi:hypothetical protein